MEIGILAQYLTKFAETLLHLGDARQLLLQTLLLFSQSQAGGCIKLLKFPAPFTVKLQ